MPQKARLKRYVFLLMMVTLLAAAIGLIVSAFIFDTPKVDANWGKPIHFTPVKEAIPKATKIVYVVIDTLRADRLGAYGYKDQPTTPSLDRIAKECTLFERFYAASSWTAPSFGTLFTGVSPLVHRTGKWLRAKEKEEDTERLGGVLMNPMRRSVQTFGELFEEYETAAFISNGFLHRKFGFARGLDHFDYSIGELFGVRRARVVTKRALRWMEKNTDKDFIALIHYFDPHTAYEPLPELKEIFAPGPGPSEMVKAPFAPNLQKLLSYRPNDKEIKFIKGLYNGELRHVDDAVGDLYAGMEKLGLLENTWLVITADHGEEHYDHGFFNHGHRYEDEVVRVPLLIRAPGGKWGAGNRIPFTASHVDLIPTFLDWNDRALPWYLEGESLVPLMTGDEAENRPCYMEFPLAPGREHWAYVDGRYKLVNEAFRKRIFIYDLKTDPKEKKKRARRFPEFKRLMREATTYRKGRHKTIKKLKKLAVDEAPVMPKDLESALKKLGYIE